MEYTEPIDVPDAQWRASALEQEMARIEQQLADPKRKFERASGRPLSDQDYQAWRAKADDALYHKKLELGYLTAWLQRKGILTSKSEPVKELLIAVETAVPVLSATVGHSHHPAIKRLLEAFGLVTGTHQS